MARPGLGDDVWLLAGNRPGELAQQRAEVVADLAAGRRHARDRNLAHGQGERGAEGTLLRQFAGAIAGEKPDVVA